MTSEETTYLEQVTQSLQEADDALDAVLNRTIAHFGADSGTIHLLGEDGHLHLKARSAGIPPPVLEKIRVIPVGKGMAGLAVSRAEPVDACNLQTDTTGDVRPGAKLTGLQGSIVVPIFRGEEPVGALGIANMAERTFTGEETSLLMEAGRRIGELGT